MRVLDVCPMSLPPLVSGSRVRVHNLLATLGEHHEVRQFCLSWDEPLPYRETLAQTGRGLAYRQYRYSSPAAWACATVARRSWVRVPVAAGAALHLTRPAWLDRLLGWADVVLVEFPWQFAYCRRRLERLGRLGRGAPGAVPLVLAAHNVERLKFESWAGAAGVGLSKVPWTRYVGRAEAAAVASADLVVAVSDEDRSTFVSRYEAEPARVVVVPNGADTDAYTTSDAPARRDAKRRLGLPDKPTVVFAGADVAPNRAGLRHMERAAHLSDRFTFLVVGTVAPPGRRGNVVSTGFVEDLALHLRAADMALCPIEHGGGTKIKLLEGWAAGLPTVAFPEALTGVAARPGRNVVVCAKEPQAVLAALDGLADDADLARRIGREARALVVERYSWRRGAERLHEALCALATPAGARIQ